jgi:N utilization substance protein B
VKAVGKRRMAREMALQMLYQHDMGDAPAAQEIFRRFDLSDYLVSGGDGRKGGRKSERRATASSAAGDPEPTQAAGPATERQRSVSEAFDYARSLVSGTLDHLEEIDALITRQADNWRLERMPAVDRNILRLAVFELLHEEDIPKLVVVDEAIELAKRFSTDQSSRFVNGLLDGLLKRRQFPGRMT